MFKQWAGSLLLTSSICIAESPYLQLDKISHYAVGASLASAGTILHSPELGLSLSFIYGVGKEAYDSKYPCCHKVEKADAVATILGGTLVYAALKTQSLRLELSQSNIPTLVYRKVLK